MIKIIIADDHQIFVEGICSILNSQENIKVIGTAATGQEVKNLVAKKSDIDIAVLDIEIPEGNGIETAKFLSLNYPNIKVIILTMFDNIGYIRKVLQAGAKGYLLKGNSKAKLIEAIQAVFNGNEYMGEEINKALIAGMRHKNMTGDIKLTRREKEVLPLIADGLTTPQISKILFIEPTTVDTHRRNLISKTGSKNTKGLVRFALEKGYTL